MNYPFSDKDVLHYGDQYQICFRYPDDTPVSLTGPQSEVLVQTANRLYERKIKIGTIISDGLLPAD